MPHKAGQPCEADSAMRAFALAICDLQLSPYSVVKVLRTGDPVLCAEAPHGTCSAPKRREGDASIHADFAVAGLRGGCPRGRVMGFRMIGGAGGARTPDLRLAKAALYQLSYGPSRTHQSRWTRRGWRMVGHPGLEPGTSVLSGLRSNHLS